MTSPSLLEQPKGSSTRSEPVWSKPVQNRPVNLTRIALPALFFCVTLFSTTAVGMRYMRNFHLGLPPLVAGADILPYAWVYHHLRQLASGLPFSLTLIAILLAHEFGHYFACRYYSVRATLPYLLPAPSLSGTFGAIIRLQSVIRSRAALIVIGASGPIAGFFVALVTITLGLALSSYSTQSVAVQAPLTLILLNRLVNPGRPLHFLLPHPVLTASWIGLLITALNLIPAGQLDGGHILYAIYPAAHKWSTRVVVIILYTLGVFSWAGWLLWATILLMPGMRHPRIPATPLTRGQKALAPICLGLLILCGTWQPFQGYSALPIIETLIHHIEKLIHHLAMSRAS